MSRRRTRWSVVVLVFGAFGLSARLAASPIQEQLAPLAEKIAEALREDKRESVTVGRFAAPEGTAAEAGPGITRALGDELVRLRFAVVAKSDVLLSGSYAALTNPQGKLLGVRVKVEMTAGGRVVRTFEGDVLFITEQATIETDGARALAPLLGLTVSLPPEESLKQRLQKCHDGSEKPQVYLEDARIKAAAASPYAVELLIGDEPRLPSVRGGRAYVDLKRGERYAVRLTNTSDQPAAVTLTIDGLSLFTFSEQKEYRFVIVPPKQTAVIRGWHRTNEESDAFEVTTYSKSAAAQLLPEAPKLGCITATFALCWPKNNRPPEEERSARLAVSRGEKLGTGRGPVVKSSFEEVEMHLGAVRAAVSVRYARPEP